MKTLDKELEAELCKLLSEYFDNEISVEYSEYDKCFYYEVAEIGQAHKTQVLLTTFKKRSYLYEHTALKIEHHFSADIIEKIGKFYKGVEE